MVGAVVATIALAGAAALLHREASPGYAAAALATFAVLLDRLRLPGHAASVLLWPLIVLVFGAGLVAVAALWRRDGSPVRPPRYKRRAANVRRRWTPPTSPSRAPPARPS